MDQADIALQRVILPGREFDLLIPKVKCKSTAAGEGLTDHSIKVMKWVIKEYSWQMSKVAKVLRRSSLEDTINAVFDFAFNHHQYKRDDDTQVLRSPACSWYCRYDGIDCKSYSIIAGSLLREMGISFYIRRIIQPASGEMWAESEEYAEIFETNFSHVYIIVPKDQKNGDLSKGYYTIDGTVSTNEEPYYLEKSDAFMSGFKHIVLNAPVVKKKFFLGLPGDEHPSTTGGTTTETTTTGTGTTTGQAATELYQGASSTGWFKKNFNMKTIMYGLKTPIGCWGGTAFNQQKVEADINSVAGFCENRLTAMNLALKENNMQLFSQRVNEFFGGIQVILYTTIAKAQERKWNSCSYNNFKSLHEANSYYVKVVGGALSAWLDQYFTSVDQGSRSFSSNGLDAGVLPFCRYITPANQQTVNFELFTKKQAAVNGFELTPYVYTLIQTPDAFDAAHYINEIKAVYAAIQNPGSIFNSGTSNGSSTTGSSTGSSASGSTAAIPKTPSQAGMQYLGYAAIAGGLWWLGMEAFKKDQPAKTPNKKQAA